MIRFSLPALAALALATAVFAQPATGASGAGLTPGARYGSGMLSGAGPGGVTGMLKDAGPGGETGMLNGAGPGGVTGMLKSL